MVVVFSRNIILLMLVETTVGSPTWSFAGAGLVGRLRFLLMSLEVRSDEMKKIIRRKVGRISVGAAA